MAFPNTFPGVRCYSTLPPAWSLHKIYTHSCAALSASGLRHAGWPGISSAGEPLLTCLEGG